MREDTPKDEYGIVEIAREYSACIMDNNTLWWDFRKTFTPEQRRRYRAEKHICLSREMFDSVIGYFRLSRQIIGCLDNMFSTPALSEEFGTRTTGDLEDELGASLEVPGRRCSFMFAAYDLAETLSMNHLKLSPEQEMRVIEIKNMLYGIGMETKVSKVNFDLYVMGLVCAETVGPAAIYTNDMELKKLFPRTEGLIAQGRIRLQHPLDFYSSKGINRTKFRRRWSLEPVQQQEVA